MDFDELDEQDGEWASRVSASAARDDEWQQFLCRRHEEALREQGLEKLRRQQADLASTTLVADELSQQEWMQLACLRDGHLLNPTLQQELGFERTKHEVLGGDFTEALVAEQDDGGGGGSLGEEENSSWLADEGEGGNEQSEPPELEEQDLEKVEAELCTRETKGTGVSTSQVLADGSLVDEADSDLIMKLGRMLDCCSLNRRVAQELDPALPRLDDMLAVLDEQEAEQRAEEEAPDLQQLLDRIDREEQEDRELEALQIYLPNAELQLAQLAEEEGEDSNPWLDNAVRFFETQRPEIDFREIMESHAGRVNQVAEVRETEEGHMENLRAKQREKVAKERLMCAERQKAAAKRGGQLGLAAAPQNEKLGCAPAPALGSKHKFAPGTGPRGYAEGRPRTSPQFGAAGSGSVLASSSSSLARSGRSGQGWHG
mmetsp:Transcript_26853/g.62623  ORF Transcript_26853/g.62623 Transcript_26853/m.62623 type:complete len:430 (-) Transcript_26853:84-1373(-)